MTILRPPANVRGRLGLLPALGGRCRDATVRIARIFSHDGPGLPESMVRGQAYRTVESRIRKTVPESSVVGMLLQSNAKVIVVKADAVGIMQHMGNSWQVAENGDFERENELTVTAQLIKRTLDDWLDTVGQKQRERAIDQIYEIFAAAGYGNIADLMANWTDSLPKIVAGRARYRPGDSGPYQSRSQGDPATRRGWCVKADQPEGLLKRRDSQMS